MLFNIIILFMIASIAWVEERMRIQDEARAAAAKRASVGSSGIGGS